jgi:hypothetical protein
MEAFRREKLAERRRESAKRFWEETDRLLREMREAPAQPGPSDTGERCC